MGMFSNGSMFERFDLFETLVDSLFMNIYGCRKAKAMMT